MAKGDEGVGCLCGKEAWEEGKVLGIVDVDFMGKLCPKIVVAVKFDAEVKDESEVGFDGGY